MRVYTIGFTKRSAENFFTTLSRSGARLIDIRLNNSSQLAGFSKHDDLRYFLRVICQMDYLHLPELAPTQEMLDADKSKSIGWDDYEKQFLALMKERKVEESVAREVIDDVLLCSEAKPDKCHRRLVAEYYRQEWGDIEVLHL